MVALNAEIEKKIVALNAKLRRDSDSERQTEEDEGTERHN